MQCGLSFSVRNGTNIPKSLQNIKKELNADIGGSIVQDGNLIPWVDQGVLLLNTSLTFLPSSPKLHLFKWAPLIQEIFEILQKNQYVVYILWGNHARSYKDYITNKNHLVLESAHPSPFSANKGFFGSKPFSKTNSYLEKHNLQTIKW